jgi:hypothetical protein
VQGGAHICPTNPTLWVDAQRTIYAHALIRIVITLPIGHTLPDFFPALTLSSPWTRATCTTCKSPSPLRLTGMQATVRRTDTLFSPIMRVPPLLCIFMPHLTLVRDYSIWVPLVELTGPQADLYAYGPSVSVSVARR